MLPHEAVSPEAVLRLVVARGRRRRVGVRYQVQLLHWSMQAAGRMEPSGHQEWAPASNRRALVTARDPDQRGGRAAALLWQSGCKGVPSPYHRRCNCRQVEDGGGLGIFRISVAAGCQRDVGCESLLSLTISNRLSFNPGVSQRTWSSVCCLGRFEDFAAASRSRAFAAASRSVRNRRRARVPVDGSWYLRRSRSRCLLGTSAMYASKVYGSPVAARIQPTPSFHS